MYWRFISPTQQYTCNNRSKILQRASMQLPVVRLFGSYMRNGIHASDRFVQEWFLVASLSRRHRFSCFDFFKFGRDAVKRIVNCSFYEWNTNNVVFVNKTQRATYLLKNTWRGLSSGDFARVQTFLISVEGSTIAGRTISNLATIFFTNASSVCETRFPP